VLLPEGAGSTEDLLTLFDGLNQRLKVTEQVRKMVGKLELLIALRQEMFTPGRTDNSLRPVDPAALEQILHDSWLCD